MKKNIILITILSIIGLTANAQQGHFTTSGTIEFERRTNVWSMIKSEINKDDEAFLAPALDAYKKTQPQYRVLKSKLTFAGNQTLFTPEEADPPANNLLADDPLMNQNNHTFSDLNTSTMISQRNIFETLFLLKDSTRRIKWKITDETREIAGYTCRRANGIILDSIYVVAFYTGKIPVPGGPESFNGLPGMILGVALPHDNITWFATKVTDMTLEPSSIRAPAKGKPVNSKEFQQVLINTSKDWGQIGKDFIKYFLM